MAGEYCIGRKLGEGGFGAVYEAEHPVIGRRAAVKVLHRVADGDSDAARRFVAEAQAVNQIRTRHIVDIFSFGKLADGRHFYVMDLLDGLPLDEFLRSHGKLELPLLLQILAPIAEALDKAHAAGIVHRDLKPQNVFLSWDAGGETVPVLLDFGIAKLMGDSPVRTASGTPIGTPLYMSPEQARGAKVDGGADIYALGVLCYELLTGSPPIQGASTVAILMAHIADQPPPPSTKCATLPVAIDVPILRMLEKAPEARPASAGQALAALRAAAEGAGVSVPSGLPRLPRPPARPLPEPQSLSPFPPTVAWSATVPADASANLQRAPALARAAGHPPASSARRPPLWLSALLLVTGVAAYLLLAPGSEPAAPSGAAARAHDDGAAQRRTKAESETRATPPPAGAVPGQSLLSEVDPNPSLQPPAPRPRKAAKKRDEHIPRDLESPF